MNELNGHYQIYPTQKNFYFTSVLWIKVSSSSKLLQIKFSWGSYVNYVHGLVGVCDSNKIYIFLN